MDTELSHISFKFGGKLCCLLYFLSMCIHTFEFLWCIGIIYGIQEWHFIWHKSRNLVWFLKRETNNSGHIFECCFGCHLHVGTNCRNLICSILFSNIFNYFFSQSIFEIDIEIGHWYTSRIEKSFKKKSKWQWIYFRNNPCQKRSRSWSSSWSYNNTILFCPTHKISHNQEVRIESHFFDYFELIF